MRRVDRPNNRAAYTLIEVLIALTVLIAGFTALASMTNRARRAAIASEELAIAQLACQTRVNELLAGVRPIAPSFNEPVAELDHWYMTTELFPAIKQGLTAVRVQVQREQQPGDTSPRFGAADLFEITSWIDNAKLDPQIVQTLQQNPYAMMLGGQTQNGMFGGPGFDMSGGMSIADSMATGEMGMMPTIPGATSFDMPGGGSIGMTSGGVLPAFDMTGTGGDIPPLPAPDDFGAGLSPELPPIDNGQTPGIFSGMTQGGVPPLAAPGETLPQQPEVSTDMPSESLPDATTEGTASDIPPLDAPDDIDVEDTEDALPDPESELDPTAVTEGGTLP